jgi:hypothetical protein
MENQIVRHTTLLDAGVDWLTCSKSGGLAGSAFDDLARGMIRMGAEDSGAAQLSTWNGYAGLRVSGGFYGTSGDNAVVTLSGPHPVVLVKQLITAADNVSRIDLQLTVEHEPADPMLGRINYRLLANNEGRSGPKPIVTVIHNSRGSHTNAVGSRLSDAYGRNYDKGIESGTRPSGTCWRYEVEFKRGMAKKIAEQIALSDKVPSIAASVVNRWWETRGVRPVGRDVSVCLVDMQFPRRIKPDYIGYLRRNVQKAVSRAIRLHGLEPVLEALGLTEHIREEVERRASDS